MVEIWYGLGCDFGLMGNFEMVAVWLKRSDYGDVSDLQ